MRQQVQLQCREIDTIFTRTNPYVSSYPYALSQLLSNDHKGKISSVLSKGKSSMIRPEQLARRWRTSLECAARTIDKIEQRALRDWTRVQGDRRFRPTQMQLRYPRVSCEIYCDIKFDPCRSLEGNTCLAVYATRFQWAEAYPLTEERNAHQSLSYLFRDVGFPSALIPDGATSLTKGEFKRVASKAQVPIYPLEPFNPNDRRRDKGRHPLISEVHGWKEYPEVIMGSSLYILSEDQKSHGPRPSDAERGVWSNYYTRPHGGYFTLSGFFNVWLVLDTFTQRFQPGKAAHETARS